MQVMWFSNSSMRWWSLVIKPVGSAINQETLEFENINYLEYKDSEKYLF
jgi:hypothetical protein